MGTVRVIDRATEAVLLDLLNHPTIWLEAESGVGMAPLERLSERGPFQDGATDLGYRLRPRTIDLVLGVGGITIADTYAARATLRRIFRPRAVPLILEYELPDGALRRWDCHVREGFDFPTGNREGFWDRTLVALVAPDPTCYDPSPVNVNFAISGGGAAFTVPTPVPTPIGASTIDQSRAIVYEGEANAYPIVRIFGPGVDPIVRSATTGDMLDFTGTSLATNEVLTIDTRPGAKTVTHTDATGAETNGIARLMESSTLSTFRLAPDPDAPGGVNSLGVSISGISSATMVDIIYYVRYLGI